MLLVIGGRFQGKHEFAKSLASPSFRTVELNGLVDSVLENNPSGDTDLEIKNILSENTDSIIITTEVGSGIVPLERKDRDYREAIGRAQVIAAKMCDEVYRVTAGIGVRIK